MRSADTVGGIAMRGCTWEKHGEWMGGSKYRNTVLDSGVEGQVELCWTFYNGLKNWVEKYEHSTLLVAGGSDPYRFFYCQLPSALQTLWSRDFLNKVRWTTVLG